MAKKKMATPAATLLARRVVTDQVKKPASPPARLEPISRPNIERKIGAKNKIKNKINKSSSIVDC
jgi:hypothetical protein